MIKPYYNEDGITLYKGDSRDILPCIGKFSSIITDPVWPNAPKDMLNKWGETDPIKLFKVVARHFPKVADRAVIILGCDSDPRILAGMPKTMPFIRTAFIEYRVPSPSGLILKGNDVVYAYGKYPVIRPGHLLPGRYMEKANDVKERRHPCPRNLQLMKWVVTWYSCIGPICDPFCGSGTTLLAAKYLQMPAVGIDKNSDYLDITIDRIRKAHILDFGTPLSLLSTI